MGGCNNNQETEDTGQGSEGTITVTVNEGDKFYYSLTTGEKVTGANTKEWDIGFQRPRTILTNSGDTATELESSGNGTVWHTGKTDFDVVTLNDAVKTGPLATYFTDTKKYFFSMSTKQQVTYNVMNYSGFSEGTGTEADPFKTASYNQEQFYIRASSSSYPVANAVYIVRHGDGNSYSKIQVSQYEYATSSDTYVVKYKTLD